MKRSFLIALSGIVASDGTAFVVHPGTQTSRSRVASSHKNGDGAFEKESSSSSSSTSALTKQQPQEVIHNSMIPSDATSSWQRADELWNQEWHDAFIRSGFVDFTPPLTDFLFCLKVGDGADDNSNHGVDQYSDFSVQLPWDSAGLSSQNEQHTFPASDFLDDSQPSLKEQRVDGALIHDPITALASTGGDTTNTHRFRYDCIFDTSLMNDIVHHDSLDGGVCFCDFDRVGTLLLEATQALQEHGIYIMITKRPMAKTPVFRDMLQEFGASFGMQWKFDLEEISRGDVHVSVARKYFAGELPSFGKLAKKMAVGREKDKLAP